MTSAIVFQQMLVIVLLICIGFFLFKKGKIPEESTKTLSYIVINITNPAVAISSAFGEKTVTHSDIITAIITCLCLYVIMIVTGHIFASILVKTADQKKIFDMLCVYSNVGFIGIPVISGVLGQEAILYPTIFCIFFNIFFYTHGYIVMLSGRDDISYKVTWKTFINIGTVSSVLAIVIFWFNIRFPSVIEDTITYSGRATTFLAMFVLGVSLAKMPLKNIFSDKKVWILWAVRYFAFPIAVGFGLKAIFGNSMMSTAMILLMAMPVANTPLMLANQYGLETDTISSEIFISTIFSLVTVSLTAFLVL